ncbi:MAG TPA: hypothetical protein VHO84_12960 [Syntrophorhabdaceae bacterium]|nr:hypothetical protein [Syntrophorhabdaceae bacterium]
MKTISWSIALILVLFLCPSCGKKTENLQQEIRVLRDENNFLKAENVALKKEIEELYKRIEERDLSRLKTQQNPEQTETVKQAPPPPEKVEKTDPTKTKKPVNGNAAGR